jgi:hypothetical protein
MRERMMHKKIDALVCMVEWAVLKKNLICLEKCIPTKKVDVLKTTGDASKLIADRASE